MLTKTHTSITICLMNSENNNQFRGCLALELLILLEIDASGANLYNFKKSLILKSPAEKRGFFLTRSDLGEK